MGELETQLVSRVVEKTQSELILFMIILVVALIAVVLPLYVMMSKDKKAKHEFESIKQDKLLAREAQIIEVIKENSSVIAGLKAALESSGTTMIEKQERLSEGLVGAMKSLERIHDRIDIVASAIEEMKEQKLYRKVKTH